MLTKASFCYFPKKHLIKQVNQSISYFSWFSNVVQKKNFKEKFNKFHSENILFSKVNSIPVEHFLNCKHSITSEKFFPTFYLFFFLWIIFISFVSPHPVFFRTFSFLSLYHPLFKHFSLRKYFSLFCFSSFNFPVSFILFLLSFSFFFFLLSSFPLPFIIFLRCFLLIYSSFFSLFSIFLQFYSCSSFLF